MRLRRSWRGDCDVISEMIGKAEHGEPDRDGPDLEQLDPDFAALADNMLVDHSGFSVQSPLVAAPSLRCIANMATRAYCNLRLYKCKVNLTGHSVDYVIGMVLECTIRRRSGKSRLHN